MRRLMQRLDLCPQSRFSILKYSAAHASLPMPPPLRNGLLRLRPLSQFQPSSVLAGHSGSNLLHELLQRDQRAYRQMLRFAVLPKLDL